MIDTSFTSNEIFAITSALELMIEDLQAEMKIVTFNEKEQYSKTIKTARDTKKLFSQRKDNATYGQLKLTVISLRSLTELIAEDLKNNTNPRERNQSLELQKDAFSAIRKLTLVIESIDN